MRIPPPRRPESTHFTLTSKPRLFSSFHSRPSIRPSRPLRGCGQASILYFVRPFNNKISPHSFSHPLSPFLSQHRVTAPLFNPSVNLHFPVPPPPFPSIPLPPFLPPPPPPPPPKMASSLASSHSSPPSSTTTTSLTSNAEQQAHTSSSSSDSDSDTPPTPGDDHADDNQGTTWSPQSTPTSCEFTWNITGYTGKRESGCKKAEYR